MTKENALAKHENVITDVANQVERMEIDGEIQMPENYSYMNALKAAYLILQETKTKDNKPVLQACTRESVANSLLNMVVQGLNPMKNQGYFIPYGNQLQFQRSYLGTIAITKRIEGIDDVQGFALYKDDVFEMAFDFKTGTQTVKNYQPNVMEWKAENLVGAFAVLIGNGEVVYTEYMPMDQIRAAWNQGQMKGKSPAHTNFPDQMAIKTVINRACKRYANTRDDSDLVMDLLTQPTDEVVAEEITQNANVEALTADYDIDPETGEILEFDDEYLKNNPPQQKAPF